MAQEFKDARIALTIDGTALEVSAIHREGDGDKAPIVFLHGFGSTKEDYADIVRHAQFDGHPFLAYDAPGCGATHCADLARIDIAFLVETALAMIERVGFKRFHLVGHSMGGLTALMLAHRHPQRVLSFVDIEGNVAPEDCFLSRQIVEHARDSDEQFFDDFVERARHAPAYASALYSASLRHKVRAKAVGPIFRSMVALSDHGDLMVKFLALPFPRLFMYGEQNASLSYLDSLREQGVALAQIANCGHFPMYSNPVAMWQSIAAFFTAARIQSCSRD
jgi:pimeloyl-ACP methyl ester carboxylesterase